MRPLHVVIVSLAAGACFLGGYAMAPRLAEPLPAIAPHSGRFAPPPLSIANPVTPVAPVQLVSESAESRPRGEWEPPERALPILTAPNPTRRWRLDEVQWRRFWSRAIEHPEGANRK